MKNRFRFPSLGRLRRMLASLALVVPMAAALPLTLAEAADPAPLRAITDPNPNFSGVWVDTVNNEIIVGDDNNHGILVYSRTATGAAVPLREIRGLNPLLDYPSQVVVDLVNNELWAVDNDTADRAVVFSRTANGDTAPLRIIDFKAKNIPENRTWGWAVDAVNNEVAGTFQRGSSVRFFNRATGDLTRTLKGPATGLADPHGIFIDTVNEEIFVANEGHVMGTSPQLPSITVYPRVFGNEPNTPPLRTIQGPGTGLGSPKQIHVDTANDEIAVTNGDGSITIYPRTANGNVAPLRTIAGPLTGINNPAGVFIDAVNNEIVVANWGSHTITVYPRTANGNIAPLRTITTNPGGPAVGFGNTGAMSLDLTHDEFAVTNCVSHPRIAFFDRLANGQAAPLRVIEGRHTRISRSLHGVAIDPVNDEVFIPSTLEDAILVFNRFDSGNVAPKRVIQGSLTRINKPQGIAFDPLNNEIALVNEASLSITVYGRLDNGNVAPLREITDASGIIAKPVGVWIDAVNNEIVVGDDAAIVVFPRTANGNTMPLRVISGTNTMINKGRQVVVDTTNDEIIFAVQGDRAVNPPVFGALLVFNRTDNGNVSPKRFIQHVTNSNVKHPRALWVDHVHDETAAGDSKENEVRIFPRLF